MLLEPRSPIPPFILYSAVILSASVVSGRVPSSETGRVFALCVMFGAFPFAVSQGALWIADHAVRMVVFKSAMDPTARIAEAIQKMDQPQRFLLAMVLNLDAADIEGTNQPGADGMVHLRPDLAVSRDRIADIVRKTQNGELPALRDQPVEYRREYHSLLDYGAIRKVGGSARFRVDDDLLWDEVKRLSGV